MSIPLKSALELLTPSQQDAHNEAAGHIRLNSPPEGRQIFPSRFIAPDEAAPGLVEIHQTMEREEREFEERRLLLEEKKRQAVEIIDAHEAATAARNALRDAVNASRGNREGYQVRLAREIEHACQHNAKFHVANGDAQPSWDHTTSILHLERQIKDITDNLPRLEKALTEQEKVLTAFRKKHGFKTPAGETI